MGNNNDNLGSVIYVADSLEQANSYKWHSDAKNLGSNVTVLAEEQIRDLGIGKPEYYLPQIISSGDILVRNPYNQWYIQSSNAESEILQESINSLALVAQSLGATGISYRICKNIESQRVFENNNSLKYKIAEAKLDIRNEVDKQIRQAIEQCAKYEKRAYTNAQYDEAKRIAEERGLLLLSDIRSLFDARNPERQSGLMTEKKVRIETYSLLNESFDMAFNLTLVPIFSINSNARMAIQKKTELTVEYVIKFD